MEIGYILTIIFAAIWLAITFRRKGETVHSVIKQLCFPDDIHFQEFPGRYKYGKRLSFGNIDIYYDSINKEQDYIMLEMSGQGCREFETFSFLNLDDLVAMCQHNSKDYHLCRIDIAFDDHTGIFDIKKIVV